MDQTGLMELANWSQNGRITEQDLDGLVDRLPRAGHLDTVLDQASDLIHRLPDGPFTDHLRRLWDQRLAS